MMDIFTCSAVSAKKAEPHHIVRKIAQGEPVTRAQAHDFLDWAVYQTRMNLAQKWENDTGEPVDPHHHHFTKLCGFAQDVLNKAFIDRRLSPHHANSEFLDGYASGHAFTTIRVNIDGKDTLILIDPTYRQFYQPDMPVHESGAVMPGHWVATQKGGAEFLKTFLEKGYVEMTPATAAMYLAAFCEGDLPLAGEEAAMEWMRNPPKPEFDLRSARNFTDLIKKGYTF